MLQTYFTRAALGPVWPFMLFAALFMAATTGFLLFARSRGLTRAFTAREHRFLQRLHDAVEMFGSLALIGGMLGACLAFFDILPALGRWAQAACDAGLSQQLHARLQAGLAPAIAGLVIGDLWAETLRFFLRPYLRACLPPPESPPETKPPAPEQNPETDWRAKDPQGMY
ncbi:MAG: hypothetical protein ONB48_19885 [candidate division KSB1 bacterium]|nr:hypothetical protein [candidate division KSB1 bacterium]MDZ7276286.1 hypothetical protein [candidate division KSB1 bacterium]MDZ7287908.1 hypothetical protein [candidate division KSB1 bacterium]MDZ7300079.1 hypothetical protein [candidate division KSB1 bacterium]MDZ7308144.1 hypothetical protein [candidate division KSB1 bacterium]